MNNKLRQEILNNLRTILNEQTGQLSGTEISKIGNNLYSSDLRNITLDFSKTFYKVLVATGFTDNVTENELRDYISGGSLNGPANSKICADGLVVVDGEGINADSLMFVKCQNGKPVSVIRGGRASTNDGIGQSLREFIKNKVVPDKSQQATQPTTQTAKQQTGQLPTACPNNAQPIATNSDGTQKCPDGTSIAAATETPSATPAEASSVQTFGNSFTCRDPRIVGLWQKMTKLQIDCKIGPKTLVSMQQNNIINKNQTFSDYFPTKKVPEQTKQQYLSFTAQMQQKACKAVEEWGTRPDVQKALASFKCPSGVAVPAAQTQPVSPSTIPAVKESKMKNQLRQKILKELNYILKEDIDRTAATTATGLGAAGVAGLGTAGAIQGASLGIGAQGVGAGITTALGYGGIGATGTAAALAGPLAIGALAIGALYLAFRTAGWQEVAEDIMDASGTMRNRPELADKLPTKKYFDLTTMTDATDKSDFMSLVSAMKGIQERLSTLQNAEEYIQFVQTVQQYKPTLDLMCGVENGISKGGFFLLNEFGLNDRLYHYKCAKVQLKMPSGQALELISGQNQQAAASAAPAGTVSENILKKFQRLLREETAPNAASNSEKCKLIDGIFLPVEFRDIGLEDAIADAPMPIQDPSLPPLPPITCPLIESICAGKNVPAPEPTPTPDEDNKTEGSGGACVRCKSVKKGCKGTVVKEIHDKLIELKLMFKVKPKPGTTGVSQGSGEISSQLFGQATEDAIVQFQKSKGLKADGIVGPATCKALKISSGKRKGSEGKGKEPAPECPSYGKGSQKCPFTAEAYDFWYKNTVATQKANKVVYFKRKPADTEPEYQSFGPQGETMALKQAIASGAQECVDCSMPAMKNLEGTSSTLSSDKRYLQQYPDTGTGPRQSQKQVQSESKQFNYENYYDFKKEKEAKLLFEKLIKKI